MFKNSLILIVLSILRRFKVYELDELIDQYQSIYYMGFHYFDKFLTFVWFFFSYLRSSHCFPYFNSPLLVHEISIEPLTAIVER